MICILSLLRDKHLFFVLSQFSLSVMSDSLQPLGLLGHPNSINQDSGY